MLRISLFLLGLLLTGDVNAQPLAEPSITIVSPNSQSVLDATNQRVPITMETSGEFLDTLIFELSTNGGSKWVVFNRQHPKELAKGTVFNLPIPDIDAYGSIRISMGDRILAVSETFKILGYPKPTALFVNDNEWPVPVDADVKIDWELSREGGLLELSQSQDLSSTWGVIARDMSPDTRSYIWHTPPFELEKVWLRLDVLGGRSKIIGPFAIKGAATVDTKQTRTLSVYPNPARGFISLGNTIQEPASIDIINASGEIVSQDASFTGSKIDVSFLPVGSYILHINFRNSTESAPFTVVR
jgi:hypothetical protein